MKTKTCKYCLENKPLEQFHKHARTKDGRQGHCKECHYDKTKKWRTENKERHEHLQRSRTLAKYGITTDDYDFMLEEQNGCCAICGLHHTQHGKALIVDHNHKTGKVRGLLCRNCNVGIGALGDSFTNLINAASYLRERGSYGEYTEYE